MFYQVLCAEFMCFDQIQIPNLENKIYNEEIVRNFRQLFFLMYFLVSYRYLKNIIEDRD